MPTQSKPRTRRDARPMALSDVLAPHFACPRGALGVIAGAVMAHHPRYRLRSRWVLSRLPITPDTRVLELGHGPGVTLGQVCTRVPRGHVTGIDLSPVMSRQAHRRNRRHIESGRLHLHCGDVTDPDTLRGSYDLIYGINIWQYWTDSQSVIAHLTQHLRPGGQLALAYVRPSYFSLTTGQAATRLHEQFEHSPLERLEVDWLPYGSVAVMVSGRRIRQAHQQIEDSPGGPRQRDPAKGEAAPGAPG
ncbi:class I SAM-dependent methyltransferase [Nocardia wallacei]|uniref:class I SAM-dependent methyltransferase n=1 Tax=Nocardia wallacei TaxID=480035 RepID=UPI0024585FCD|nr:class I SAM-dependent methyltransferase [Nocardia wallacei]